MKPTGWRGDSKGHRKAALKRRTVSGIPKKKMLIGHSEKEDYYQDENGKNWAYSGSKFEHWNNPKFWTKLTKG